MIIYACPKTLYQKFINAYVVLQASDDDDKTKQEFVFEGNDQWRELKKDKQKVESMIAKAKKVNTKGAPKKKTKKKAPPTCPDGVYKNPTTLYQKFVNTYILTECKDKNKREGCLEAIAKWKEIKDDKALVEQLVEGS